MNLRKGYTGALLAALLLACSGCPQGTETGNAGKPTPLPTSAAMSIGPDGGEITFRGAKLVVPPGALTATTDITVMLTNDQPPPGYPDYSPVFRFLPAGTTFLLPATVTLGFNGEPDKAALFWTTPDFDGYERLDAVASDHSITGQIMHFSQGFAGNGEEAPESLDLIGPPDGVLFPDSPWPLLSVAIRNSLGEIDTAAANCVTAKVTSGTGTLTGNVTECAVNGIVTFDTLAYDTVENIQISLTSPGLVGIFGLPLFVWPGDAQIADQFTAHSVRLQLGDAAVTIPEIQPGSPFGGTAPLNLSLDRAEDPAPPGYDPLSPLYRLSPENFILIDPLYPDTGIPPATVQIPYDAVSAEPALFEIDNLGNIVRLDGAAAQTADGPVFIAHFRQFGTFFVADAATAPDHLTIIQNPSLSVLVGAKWPQVSVEIRDVQESAVPDAVRCVTLVPQVGGAALSGTLTRCAANGVAIFNDLSASSTGVIMFGFTAPGLQAATGGFASVRTATPNANRIPGFALDCYVDNVPLDAGGSPVSRCADDGRSANPNTPAYLRLGTFGSTVERNAASDIPPANQTSMSGLNWYNRNFQSRLSYLNGVSSDFGANYSPPLSQRIVGTNRVSFDGRFAAFDGSIPSVIVNEDASIVTRSDGILSGTGSVEQPGGFFQQVTGGGAGTATVNLSGPLPSDNPSSVVDNAIRAGDHVVLSSLNSNQQVNAGIYTITEIISPTQLKLSRTLPADAAGMTIQGEYDWNARYVYLPVEGINTFSFRVTDSAQNTYVTVFPVVRDTLPPQVEIIGSRWEEFRNSAQPFTVFENHPVVRATDPNLFLGGVYEDPAKGNCFDLSLPTDPGACVIQPQTSMVMVRRLDGAGLDADGIAVHLEYAAYGKRFAGGDTGDLRSSYVMPYELSLFDHTTHTSGYNRALSSPPVTTYFPNGLAVDLGTASGPSVSDDPMITRPSTLAGDGSCEYAVSVSDLSCAPGSAVDQQIVARFYDLLGNTSSYSIRFILQDVPAEQIVPLPFTPVSPAAGQTINLKVALQDLAGSMATVPETLPVTVELMSGSGVMSGQTGANSYHGTAEFQVTYNVAETIQVRFTAPGLPPSSNLQIVVGP